MKQKDIILIIVVVFITGVVSFFLSNYFIGSPKDRKETVEVVHKIDSTFPEPDKRFFNPDAIDPTKLIQIGENQNTKPFNSQTQ